MSGGRGPAFARLMARAQPGPQQIGEVFGRVAGYSAWSKVTPGGGGGAATVETDGVSVVGDGSPGAPITAAIIDGGTF